jgi:hypothetical protein
MTVATKPEQKVARVPKNIPTLTEREPGEVGSINALLNLALDKGASVETLDKLLTLHQRVAAIEAAKEFAGALSRFQSSCPPISKSSTAKIVTKGGGSYSYKYAELDEIARTINPRLAAEGLSYSWDSVVAEKHITIVCTLRHINGHSVTASIVLPIDNPSAMNDQQKVKAALTFGQRCSLISVTGITTGDPDHDGAGGDTLKPVSDDQALAITDGITESGIDKGRFLAWLGVSAVAEIPADRFTTVMQAIEQKRREKEKAGR